MSSCPFGGPKALTEDELAATPLGVPLIELHHFSPLFT